MNTYISILRGINVSGKNILKMEALRKMYENLGFQKVQTYIQSGNVVFQAKEFTNHLLASNLTFEIQNKFGLDIPVIVINIKELQSILQENPFLRDPEKDSSFFHITFFSEKLQDFDLSFFEEKKHIEEAFHFKNKTLYLYCPLGYGQTKLTNSFLEKKLNVRATTRNWKTANALLKIAFESEGDHHAGVKEIH